MATFPGDKELHIYLRNLVRDRTCGSVAELQKAGGPLVVAKQLSVDPEKGVDSSDLDRRAKDYGDNVPPVAEMTTYFGFLFDAFSDFTVLMLCGAAVVSLVLAIAYERTSSSYAEGVAIIVSILIVTNVTAINDYRKQAQFVRLNATVDDVSVRCIRDGGTVQDVKSAHLVCGDIIQIAVGDILPADGLLVKGDGVSTDESALTGEPKLIRKDPVDCPFLLSGTKVMEGSGLMIVIAVGVHSEAGQIRELIRIKKKDETTTVVPPKKTVVNDSTGGAVTGGEIIPDSSSSVDDADTEKSVLTAKLDRIALRIGYVATIVSIIALIVMCTSFSILTYVRTDHTYVCAYISDAVCGSTTVNDYSSDGMGFPLCGGSNNQYPCCSNTTNGDVELLGSPCGWMKNHAAEYLSFLVTAITILVVAVPEGLPLAVTLSLAFSVRKMQDENNLVKHLDACETMGSATTICSDKTGTLTKNRMTVVRSVVGVSSPSISLKELNTTDKAAVVVGSTAKSTLKGLIAEAIALSGNADVKWNEQVRLWDQIGSKTECALLGVVADDFKMNYESVRKTRGDKVVKRFPFSSAAKKSSFVIPLEVPSGPPALRIYTIGASEILLDQCSSYVDPSVDSQTGLSLCQFSLPTRTSVEKRIEEFASKAMRTVVLAFKDIPASINLDSVTADESGMTFCCLFGIEDPLRDEVPGAILKCNNAGVQVKMVTGDNLNTAVAIAKNCNIIRKSDMDPITHELLPNVAMTGPEFRSRVLDPQGNIIQSELDSIWPHLRVLARSSPTDKYNLVTGMIDSKLRISDRNDRQVVAVTGDGTNDAPALKKADVGFAMGITGTAVARDAADIILLDDNFASIVVACKWGRNVYDSIAKFLQFQLTVNIVAVTIALEGAFIYNESPIGAVQMLWVNLIMDALASLALATEPPTESLLDRQPHGRSESVLSSTMIWNISVQAVFQLIVLNLFFFFAPTWFDIPSGVGLGHDAPPTEHYTLMFNALVCMQLANQINSRKLAHELNVFRGLFNNAYFVTILFAETVLQVVFVEFGGPGVGTQSLSGVLWAVSVGTALGSFPVYWLTILIRKLAHKFLPASCFAPPMSSSTKQQDSSSVMGGGSLPGSSGRLVVSGGTIEMVSEKPISNSVVFDPRASVISPLPAKSRTPPPHADLEAGSSGRIRVTSSAQNLGRLNKQNSLTSLKSLSAKSLRDLVEPPSVAQLQKTKTGGFKNQRRQTNTNVRFKSLYSFDNKETEFLEAAKEYKRSSSHKS